MHRDITSGTGTYNPHLTERELEVLTLVVQGMKNQEVADALFLSRRTVDFHLVRIYEKLDVRNRVEASNAAIKLGLMQPRAEAPAMIQ